MAKAQQQGVMLNPETYGEGGGLLDDVRVIFKEVCFEMFDYNGTRTDDPSPALKVVMEIVGDDDDMGDVPEFFTCGDSKFWEPSKDGTRLIPIGSATVINKKSKAAILIESIVISGFPSDQIEDDCSVFEGMDCHVSRVKATVPSGLSRTPRMDGKEYNPTNLIVDKIFTPPGEGDEKGSGKGTGGGASDDDAITSQAEEVLMDILTESGKPVTKKGITAPAYKVLKADPNRQALMKLLIDDEFLSDEARPWTFDKKKSAVSIG